MTTKEEKQAALEQAKEVAKYAQTVLGNIEGIYDSMSDLNFIARFASKTLLSADADDEDEVLEAESLSEDWSEIRRVVQDAEARLRELAAHVGHVIAIAETISETIAEDAALDDGQETS